MKTPEQMKYDKQSAAVKQEPNAIPREVKPERNSYIDLANEAAVVKAGKR